VTVEYDPAAVGRQSIRSVAILGGGPSGASLGAALARKGLNVAIFSTGERPPVIVGESLVPAIVPYIRKLGVEDEVASYSQWKGGATFVLNAQDRMSIRFTEARGAKTTYSYNVPRDRFDATILKAAERAGAVVVPAMGRVERDGAGDRIRLSDGSLAAASHVFGGEQPDFIVDAGGRRRQVARLMDIETWTGKRRDTALHAHLEGVEVEVEGNVHTDRLENAGWCWRIPLPGRVSLGFVVDTDFIREFGDTPEEQFDAYLSHEPVVKDWARDAKRITPVVKYTNYQLRAARGVGENWALVGDAYGFVDPVFSSGLLIAFEAAEDLAKAILSGKPKHFTRFEKRTQESFTGWQRVIEYFYSGQLLTLFRVGEVVRTTRIGKIMDFHLRKYMPRIFTGEAAHSRYSLELVSFMSEYGLAGNDPADLRIN
jgi:flavin-dependent dehydrogenase